MHIPDGFLDAKTAVVTASLSAVGLGLALRRAKRQLPARRVPLLGLAAAFIFVAQMVNFPVGGGTSGHLVGAVLASVLLGPGPGVIVLSCVLIVQCLLFADGGLLALGANLFNMAIAGCVAGYAIARVIRHLIPGSRGVLIGAGFAGWCTTVLAASLCAGELAWSGTVPWGAGFPAMAQVHMVVGIGESLITMLVLAAILKARPDLLGESHGHPMPAGLGVMAGYSALVTLGVILFLVPFASPWPDGLERVAMTLGFPWHSAPASSFSSPLAGYAVPGLGIPLGGTVIAGCLGAVVVFLMAFVLARSLAPAHDARDRAK